MKQAAFYAPMKPPDDPMPSGDRTMARALMKALLGAGYTPQLASRFRSREARGEREVQEKHFEAAKVEIRKLLDKPESKSWHFWLTYHNYYKAPDLIGPAVSRALDIPYLLVEATRARKRLGGPWDAYAQAAEAASEAANAIFYVTERDAEALAAYAPEGQRLVHLAPFLPVSELPSASPCPSGLLSVGMFRKGDKLASYQLIAQTLALLTSTDWHLKIVGDGPERSCVEQLMAPFSDRVSLVGALGSDALQDEYKNAGILLWPGVNEAFGMVYLEAQAAGLTVVAQDRPGVRDVLAPNLPRPSVEAGPPALARQIDHLLSDDASRVKTGHASRQFIETKHLLKHASLTMGTAIREIIA